MSRSQRRILLTDCQLNQQDGRVQARVTLLEADGRTAVGAAERPQGKDADLWCSAEATVDALHRVLEIPTGTLVLKDIVTLDISDGAGVAVALRATFEGAKRRLFGLAPAEPDRARSAAKAVLAATNRFMEMAEPG
jgi:hypothetical protein